MIPAIIPESGGAPDASAIPRHNGSATKNTTSPEGKFSLIPAYIESVFFIFLKNCAAFSHSWPFGISYRKYPETVCDYSG